MKTSGPSATMSVQSGSPTDRVYSKNTALNLPLNPQLEWNERYVGMIIPQKPVKASAIHNVLKLAWERYGSVRISDVSDRVFMFDFEKRMIGSKSKWEEQWASIK